MSEFDAIVVGSGHNGLGMACYLGKSGLKVLVCEALPVVGGYLNTEEPIPGYKHSMHAITLGTYPPFYRDFDLAHYGVKLIKTEVEHGLIHGKRSLPIENGLPKVNYKAFAKFSEKDARTIGMLHKRFHKTWMNEYYSPPKSMEGRGEGLDGGDRGEWQRMCSMSPRELLDELFENETIKLFFALRMAEEGGEAYLWTSKTMRKEFGGTGDHLFKMLIDPEYVIPEGGTRRLAEGMVRIVEAHGGTVLTGAPVEQILVKDGKASGVRLKNGKTFDANKLVACNVDIFTTLELIQEENLEPNLVKNIKSIRTRELGQFDLHLAVKEPASYSHVDDSRVNQALHVNIGYEGLDDIDRFTKDAQEGRFPEKPPIEVNSQSLYDSTLAPPGKHTLSMWTAVSAKICLNITETEVERYTEKITSHLREYAPNITNETILGTYNYYSKNWRSKRGPPSSGYGQYYGGRPIAELSRYKTPIAGLYLCHSSSHPGSTVRFGPCYNALTVIAEDIGLSKWWSDPLPGKPYALE